ncbi:DDE-type integrase/transposase/recombinase [Arcticibacter sp. MXS-1]|uniref:DDE-type integrase/transposase/recombinase n=1 Tax=Arcticibacter sp. MXS-1 TaxID=3341726 RepID=UPI0035A91D75
MERKSGALCSGISISIAVDTGLPAQRVIRELEQLIEWRGKPEKIRSDNGPEFVAGILSQWCQGQGIEWEYIQPGKPTQNSLVERFNRTFRVSARRTHLLGLD